MSSINSTNLPATAPGVSPSVAAPAQARDESKVYHRAVIDTNHEVHQQGVRIISAQTQHLAAREQLREAQKTLAILECAWAKIDKTKTGHSPEIAALAKKVVKATEKLFVDKKAVMGLFDSVDKTQMKEKLQPTIIAQRAYIKKLEKNLENLPELSNSEKEVESSILYAKNFIHPPDPKHPGETLPTPDAINKLQPGEFVTLSRQGVLDQTGKADLPRSVDIIRTSDPKNPYLFLVHQHDKPAKTETAAKPETKKQIAKGGLNRILKGEYYNTDMTKASEVVRRVPIEVGKKLSVEEQRQIETEKKLSDVPHTEHALASGVRLEQQTGKKNIIKSGEGGIYPLLKREREFLHADNIDPNSFLRLNIDGKVQGLPCTKQWVNFCKTECQGFAALHERGIYHMDGSQKNIGVDANGDPLIRDFDTCLHLDGGAPIGKEWEALQKMGTEGWFPPEMGIAFNGDVPADESKRYENKPEDRGPPLHTTLTDVPRIVPQNGSATCNLTAEVNAVKEALGRIKSGAGTVEDRMLVKTFYEKVDCYIQASNLYLKMTGSVPPFTMKIITKFFPLEQTARYHAGQPEFKAQMETALAEANQKGWPKELTDMVMRGLSPVPSDRPTMKEMAAAFERHSASLT